MIDEESDMVITTMPVSSNPTKLKGTWKVVVSKLWHFIDLEGEEYVCCFGCHSWGRKLVKRHRVRRVTRCRKCGAK